MVDTYRKECCGNTKIISIDDSVASHSSVLAVQHCSVTANLVVRLSGSMTRVGRPVGQVKCIVAKCSLQNVRCIGKSKFVPASTELHHSRKTHKSFIRSVAAHFINVGSK